MPELRVTVTEKLNELLDKIVEAGLFASKADAVRAATVYFLKDLGWLKKPRKTTYPDVLLSHRLWLSRFAGYLSHVYAADNLT